jgi:hypothetical protein
MRRKSTTKQRCFRLVEILLQILDVVSTAASFATWTTTFIAFCRRQSVALKSRAIRGFVSSPHLFALAFYLLLLHDS